MTSINMMTVAIFFIMTMTTDIMILYHDVNEKKLT